jgi:hypothetical protein
VVLIDRLGVRRQAIEKDVVGVCFYFPSHSAICRSGSHK